MISNKVGYELLEFIPCDEKDLVNYENITGAGIVFKVDNNYLVGYNNWRKQWEIPAGKIEEGETAKVAAIRELFEESHQKADNAEFVGLFKKRRPNKEIVYMAIFLCVKDHIVPFIKKDDDEFDEIKLWNLKDEIGDVDKIDLEIIKTVNKVVNVKTNLK